MTSNWQDNLTLVESLDYMLTNQVDCDVSFKLGKAGSDIIPAHKFVLAMRSSVFRAMLFGPLAEKDSVVGIPDVESDTFKCFLRYLYTDQCLVTADNALSLMYVANKYGVGLLVKKCGQFISDNLSTSNVCTIMEAAHLYDNQDLRQSCLKLIEKHTDDIMRENHLLDLGPECLGDVLRSDNLRAREEDIFTAVLSWADRRCTEKDLEVSDPNRRQVLGDLLYLLRFPLMSQEKFVTVSERNDQSLLSLQEQVDMFRGYVTGDFSNSPFSSKNRSGRGTKVDMFGGFMTASSITDDDVTGDFSNSPFSSKNRSGRGTKKICYRFQTKDVKSEGLCWQNNGKTDALKFKVSEPVTITGVVLFGCSVGSTTYNVRVEIVELGQLISTTVASKSDEKTFDVMFSNPVKVQPNTDYTLKVCLTKGSKSYYGENGMSDVRCENITFTFSSSKLSTNGTGVLRGQIFGITFYRN